jgi:hypothetical protein
MRTTPSNSAENAKGKMPEPAVGWATRTKTDATGLLVEFARALRGFRFYGEADAQRLSLLDRAFRAVSGELNRAGAIEIELTSGGFRVAGIAQLVDSGGVLGPIESALRDHDIRHLELDPTLSSNALHAFLDLLGHPHDRYESVESFARALAARDSQGLRLNGFDAAGASKTPKLTATPLRASVYIGSMLISAENGRPIPPAAQTEEEASSLERHPLDAPAAEDRGERLRARLIELDRTVDDAEYRKRAADITVWAGDLWNEGLKDECYRALLVLADHSVGSGGRPETQARTAAACFVELANGDRLHDLIDRATCSTDGGVRAAQLLLQLGSTAVSAIVDRICDEQDLDLAAPLHSLVLALGEASVPMLISTIEGFDDERALIGIRLAGELQNPAVLPSLLKSLRTSSVSRRVEAIRALSYLPGQGAKSALAQALAEDR